MNTNWNLIREVMNSVVDACESIENLHLTDEERNAVLAAAPANVYDALQSLWTYPENVQDEVIRARHELNINQDYTPETARALVNAAKVCAELIAAGNAPTVEEPVKKMAQWYSSHLVSQVNQAVETDRNSVSV